MNESSTLNQIPDKYDPTLVEQKWAQEWDKTNIYQSNFEAPRDNTYIVDTPPPTASGSLHMGHIFGYTHQDVMVRFHRMLGKAIVYPMGWDDNGLPTERRVQNYLAIRCNPYLPYDPNWKWKADKSEKDKAKVEEVSRQNFLEACDWVCKEDEKSYEALWRRLGLSVDWKLTYATIDRHSQKISQWGFLDLVNKGYVVNTTSATVWDVDFRSAVAQAEIEDRETDGMFYDVKFAVEGGGEFTIATTRPELIPACIAVVAHPSDERYKGLFGKYAITPLFSAAVPIVASEHADPEKGTGIMQISTFGDIADVEWWKKSELPIKQIIGVDGKLLPVKHGEGSFKSINPQLADHNYAQLTGLRAKEARKKIAELLGVEGRPVRHVVKFYEKGDKPLEFVPTRQWFIKVLDYKQELLEQGRKIKWYPEHMRVIYENWVNGLNQEWCISRQRYFGVPFPVWYPVLADGQPDFGNPIFANKEQLPVDPMSVPPIGYKEEQRDQPGGFTADKDVMDTWATSSMSPQLISNWGFDEGRHRKVFPMDLRPQGKDIIRTWAFGTIAMAWLHHREIPWKEILVNGWILDPDRKKMSKSKGNVVTPSKLLEDNSSDAVRYWAAKARLGVDTTIDEGIFKIGRRLTTKIFNASKFVLGQIQGADLNKLASANINQPLDLSFLAALRALVEETKTNYNKYEFAASLQSTEELFWSFCDNYLELVKRRSYMEADSVEKNSALATLRFTLNILLRLFAPITPYVTEEVWSWGVGQGSIHQAVWPSDKEFGNLNLEVGPLAYQVASEVISKVRGAKTDAKKSLKWPVAKLEVKAKPELLEKLELVKDDLERAGNLESGALRLLAGTAEGLEVAVVLSEHPPAD